MQIAMQTAKPTLASAKLTNSNVASEIIEIHTPRFDIILNFTFRFNVIFYDFFAPGA
jgi:hypothetical protein